MLHSRGKRRVLARAQDCSHRRGLPIVGIGWHVLGLKLCKHFALLNRLAAMHEDCKA
jgi:hypothetical protein